MYVESENKVDKPRTSGYRTNTHAQCTPILYPDDMS